MDDNTPRRFDIAEKQRTEIDAGLLEELRQVAREQDRREDEVLEEVVRRYLVAEASRSKNLIDLFDRDHKEGLLATDR